MKIIKGNRKKRKKFWLRITLISIPIILILIVMPILRYYYVDFDIFFKKSISNVYNKKLSDYVSLYFPTFLLLMLSYICYDFSRKIKREKRYPLKSNDAIFDSKLFESEDALRKSKEFYRNFVIFLIIGIISFIGATFILLYRNT